MEQNGNLESKYEMIEKAFKDQEIFYSNEVQALFPTLKKNTLYWNLSKLVEEGYVRRIRNGVYALNTWKGKNQVTLSKNVEKVMELMDETGFQYFISGTDILAKYMQHVPEQYPIILFAEKAAKEEVTDVLRGGNILVLEPNDLKQTYEKIVFLGDGRIQTVLYPTENFDFCKDRLATAEKAFVDLYYAISRNGYPIAIAELVRMYRNMTRLGMLDKKGVIAAASKRNLQYDIRFIVESKFITDDAFQFVDLLRQED